MGYKACIKILEDIKERETIKDQDIKRRIDQELKRWELRVTKGAKY